MSLSLMQIGAKKQRRLIASRFLIAWLSLSLFLTLTPCCEIFADAVASPVNDVGPDHEHDGPDSAHHSTESGGFHDPCAPWLDHADYTLNSLHVVATSGYDSHHNVPPASLLWVMPVAGTLVTMQASYHPPPVPALPLYLRIEHLLL